MYDLSKTNTTAEYRMPVTSKTECSIPDSQCLDNGHLTSLKSPKNLKIASIYDMAQLLKSPAVHHKKKSGIAAEQRLFWIYLAGKE